MIDKPLDAITKDDIDALAAAAVPERRTLDYKQELPGGSDGARKEFLGDIASFANAAGGDILYGVRDIRDENNRPTGTPELLGLADFNTDREKLRLDQMIRNGIAPRVPGVAFRVIEGFSKGPVLIVRVPRSWLALHMVTFQEHSRFYTRNAAGRYVMDVQEIRSGFLLAEELPEKVRRFRDDRLARIVAGETPVPMPDRARNVLHLVPASAFTRTGGIEVAPLGGLRSDLQPMSTSAWDGRFNFDGYVTFSKDRSTYVQILRNGGIEAVSSRAFRGDIIDGTAWEAELANGFTRYLGIQQQLDIGPPIFVLISLVGVSGLHMRPGAGSAYDHINAPVDRDALLLPDVLVESYGDANVAILRSAFDALWQAAGYNQSASRGSEN